MSNSADSVWLCDQDLQLSRGACQVEFTLQNSHIVSPGQMLEVCLGKIILYFSSKKQKCVTDLWLV